MTNAKLRVKSVEAIDTVNICAIIDLFSETNLSDKFRITGIKPNRQNRAARHMYDWYKF